MQQPIPTHELRYLLVDLIDRAGQPLSIAELAAALDQLGIPVAAPANKTVSDALRRQLVRGRVVRTKRGVYGSGSMPKSTRYYIRNRARRTRHDFATTLDSATVETVPRSKPGR